ncbi:hypothetical protein [Candidatus Deferrimicrobium sp.]|uniref:hypothetical protein n=1 Tax=Candidatus Deferrimicrobium sp. TaxID=3060586 RepID=UPI002ED3ABDB
MSICSEARDIFPAIRRRAASSGTGISPAEGSFPDGSSGTGSQRIRSSLTTIAGTGSRTWRAERSGRSGAAYFSRSAGALDPPTSAAATGGADRQSQRAAEEKSDGATSA